MKEKTLNFFALITSLLGYLEWGGNSHIFLFQAEYEIFSKLFVNQMSVAHPMIFFPLIGQFLLLITLFQNKPSRLLTFSGVGSLSVLLLFMLIIGVLSLKIKIIVSVIPFLIVSILIFRHNMKHKN